MIKVQSTQNIGEKYNFKLIDSRGREVKNENFDNELKVERANLSEGIYIVLLSYNGNIYQQKVFLNS